MDQVELIQPRWDRVPGDPEMTKFKRAARAHQSQWRAHQGHPHGEYPVGVANGSMLSEEVGATFANFLGPRIVEAVRHRCSPEQSQRWQTFDARRLRSNLLSSMPMCFNLFGELHADAERIGQAGLALFGVNAPGHRVEFEWSPERNSPEYTGDRTAFDVALFFGAPDSSQCVVGIETKYHEHAVIEKPPNEATRMPRYREITENAREQHQVFRADWERRIVGTRLQQIWRDHLLLLSMLQHPSGAWSGGKYVLVYPSGNSSFRQLADQYCDVLSDSSTFDHVTVERLLDAHVLHDPATEKRFRKRYFW